MKTLLILFALNLSACALARQTDFDQKFAESNERMRKLMVEGLNKVDREVGSKTLSDWDRHVSADVVFVYEIPENRPFSGLPKTVKSK